GGHEPSIRADVQARNSFLRFVAVQPAAFWGGSYFPAPDVGAVHFEAQPAVVPAESEPKAIGAHQLPAGAGVPQTCRSIPAAGGQQVPVMAKGEIEHIAAVAFTNGLWLARAPVPNVSVHVAGAGQELAVVTPGNAHERVRMGNGSHQVAP